VGLSLVMAVFLAHSMGKFSLTLTAVSFAFMACALTTSNVFGYDDTAIVHLLAVGAPWRKVLVGKVLAIPVVVVPLLAVVLLEEAALNHTWADLFAAFVTGLAFVVLAVGLGAFASVWAPQNRVEPAGSKVQPRLAVTLEFALLVVVLAAVLLGGAVLASRITPGTWASAWLATSALLTWSLLVTAGSWLARDPFRVVAALRP